MNEGLFPPAIVQYDTVAVDQLKFELDSAIDAGDGCFKTGTQRYREAGTILLKIKEVLPHGYFEAWTSKHVDRSSRQLRRWMLLAKTDVNVRFEEEWAIINGNRDEDIEAEEKKEKPTNPDLCPKCSRLVAPVFGCEACKRVKEENRKKAKKKPKASGRQAKSSAQPSDDRPKPPKEQPPEEPIARKVFYSKKGLRKLLSKLMYAKDFPANETKRALDAFAEGFEITDRLAAAAHRPPGDSKCKKCGQDIKYITTENWTRAKFQPEPEIGGDHELMNGMAVKVQRERGSGVKLWKMHYMSCFPKSDKPLFAEE